MKNKINVLIITIILTVILFSISTYMQRKIIDYEPTIKCLILKEDIMANTKITEDNVKLIDMPITVVANTKIVQGYNEIKELYSKDNIYAGQILIAKQFDTKENLSIFEWEEEKEKISIKIKSPENATSYQLREGSIINIYSTIRADLATKFLTEKERNIIGDEYDGYIVIKMLENVKVLGVFDANGIQVTQNGVDYIPDSMLIAVTPEEAKNINLIRDIAIFNITEVKEKNEMENEN